MCPNRPTGAGKIKNNSGDVSEHNGPQLKRRCLYLPLGKDGVVDGECQWGRRDKQAAAELSCRWSEAARVTDCPLAGCKAAFEGGSRWGVKDPAATTLTLRRHEKVWWEGPFCFLPLTVVRCRLLCRSTVCSGDMETNVFLCCCKRDLVWLKSLKGPKQDPEKHHNTHPTINIFYFFKSQSNSDTLDKLSCKKQTGSLSVRENHQFRTLPWWCIHRNIGIFILTQHPFSGFASGTPTFVRASGAVKVWRRSQRCRRHHRSKLPLCRSYTSQTVTLPSALCSTNTGVSLFSFLLYFDSMKRE